MKKWIRVWASVGLSVAVLPLAGRGEDPRAGILKALGERAAALAPCPKPLPDVAAARKLRCSQLQKQLAEALGLPSREPMKAAVEFQKEEGGLAIEEVVFHWAGRTYSCGHVIRPKDLAGRRPALVICPGHLAHYTWQGYRELSEGMARAGFLVLFLEDPRIGKRHAAEAGLYAVAEGAGLPIAGIQVFDALRGLDYLLTRPDVAAGRIGILGVGPGASHAWLAAALERRFGFVVPVGGRSPLETLSQLYDPGVDAIADPSVCPGAVLRVAAWEEIVGCVGPRPTFLRRGPARGPSERGGGLSPFSRSENGAVPFLLLDAQSVQAIETWVLEQVQSLPDAPSVPLACAKPDKPEFCVLGYLRERINRQASERAKNLASPAAWAAYRDRLTAWLETTCGVQGITAAVKSGKPAIAEGMNVQTIELALDRAIRFPAILAYPVAPGGPKRPAVILSHDRRHAAGAPEVQHTVRQLVSQGYWVMVPEHVSIHPKSPRKLELRDMPAYCALADMAGTSALGLRAAENAACFRYLAERPEVDASQIVMGGSGIGALDACLAALCEKRIAGVAAVDVTTLGDWAETTAPEQIDFVHPMPYLPGMAAVTDFDYCFAAIAPRPLALARLKGGWAKSGFDQVASTAAAAYKLVGNDMGLVALGPRDFLDDRVEQAEGALKHVRALARAILPEPPVPGVVGTREGLHSRNVVDSASGLIWVLSAVGGEDQEFCDAGYRIDSWSFFNDNGPAQKGLALTPLVFKREGAGYKLTAIGKTRCNAGTGLQSFPFELVEGDDRVGAGYLFGFYTGDPRAKPNTGVVEYDDDPENRMTILTLDGRMDDQKVILGQVYRQQSQWPRAYSIQATSKRK